jgi:hypothetical protein
MLFSEVGIASKKWSCFLEIVVGMWILSEIRASALIRFISCYETKRPIHIVSKCQELGRRTTAHTNRR